MGQEATELFTLAGWQVTACDRSRLDITDRRAVFDAVSGLRPDAVLNLAAWNAVDLAETEVDGLDAAISVSRDGELSLIRLSDRLIAGLPAADPKAPPAKPAEWAIEGVKLSNEQGAAVPFNAAPPAILKSCP